MGKRSNFPRIERDFYVTPFEAVVPLIPHLRGVHTFAEPCCGDGALVRHLESFGLRCVFANDIATGQDALEVASFGAPVVTNTPWRKAVKHAMIAHFMRAAPFVWMLFDAAWPNTKQSRPLIKHCTHILPIGRVQWIPNSPHKSGKEDACWYRFELSHEAGAVMLPYRADAPIKSRSCRQCGTPYRQQRSDSQFCSGTCRMRSHRERLAVTQTSPETL